MAPRTLDPPEHPAAAWVVRRTPERIRPAVALVVRTVRDAIDDRVVGLSAEVAFFAILAVPPLLLTIVAALGFVPGDQTTAFVDGMVAASLRVFTEATVDQVIRPVLESVVESERIDVLSFAFAVAVFSASRAVRVIFTAVTIAYDLETERPSWAQRIWGLLVTLVLLVVVPIMLPLLLAGPDLGLQLAAGSAAIPLWVADLWPYGYWLGIGLGTVLAVTGLYQLAAPWWTPFRRDLPGAFLAVGIWLAASRGLRAYAEQAAIGGEVFQLLAGPIVLLIWLYLLAFGVILGAELNAELERMFPSPEQQRAPASERLRQRLLDTEAGHRLKEARTELLDRVSTAEGEPDDQRDGEPSTTGR